jgi:DNA-directed RNA polymerase subunit M/transcription elongation factor TFIIS
MSADSAADHIVLLESFPNYVAAHVAKSRLDAESIPCFLSNENRPYGPIAGGVRLHVRQQDLGAAQQVLLDQVVPMRVASPEEETAARTCPRCGSHDVSSEPVLDPSANVPMRLFALLSWSLRGEYYHCFHCGYEFKG